MKALNPSTSTTKQQEMLERDRPGMYSTMAKRGQTSTDGARATAEPRAKRRGIATIWIIASGCVLLALLCMVVDIANLWLARIELKTALEAAALAAVKEWGDGGGGDTEDARTVGVDYAGTNTVVGVPLMITKNYNNGKTNDNGDCKGNLVFGAITTGNAPHEFDAGFEPCQMGGNDEAFAVRAQATASVESFWKNLLAPTVTTFDVSAKATAFYACGTGPPRLIHVETFTCP